MGRAGGPVPAPRRGLGLGPIAMAAAGKGARAEREQGDRSLSLREPLFPSRARPPRRCLLLPPTPRALGAAPPGLRGHPAPMLPAPASSRQLWASALRGSARGQRAGAARDPGVRRPESLLGPVRSATPRRGGPSPAVGLASHGRRGLRETLGRTGGSRRRGECTGPAGSVGDGSAFGSS